MKRCFLRVLSCLIALAVAAIPAVPASAVLGKSYIKEIRIGYDDDGIQALTDAGYTVMKNPSTNEALDVNKGGTGSAVYLGYTTTKKEDEAITDVAVLPIEESEGYEYPNISEWHQLLIPSESGETLSFNYYAARLEGAAKPVKTDTAEAATDGTDMVDSETESGEETSETEDGEITTEDILSLIEEATSETETATERKTATTSKDTAEAETEPTYTSPTALIFGDLNGNNRESPYLCLYYARDLRLGSPLTADIFTQSSSSVTAVQRKSYLPIHEMDDYAHLSYFQANSTSFAPVNLNKTSGALVPFDIYVFLKRDNSVQPLSVSRITDSPLIIAAIGFIAGGGIASAVIIPVMKKKKKRTSRHSAPQKH